MSTRVIESSNGTPLRLRVRGGQLTDLEFTGEPGRTRIQAELEGDDEALAAVRVAAQADTWTLLLPHGRDPLRVVIRVPEGTLIEAETEMAITGRVAH